jgi:hypothetical protein
MSQLHLRVFISSPADVDIERALARELIAQALPAESFIRGRVTFEAVTWDDPHATVAMPAQMTPHQAIERGLPRPSECDVVVVILWSRMGTPLPDEFRKADGEPYVSGTEWEYEEAMRGARESGYPTVLVYRRTEALKISPDNPRLDDMITQWRRVEAFFTRFRDQHGSLRGGFHAYDRPERFAELLRGHLRDEVRRRVEGTQKRPDRRALAIDRRIRAFLEEYLISETGPVPFGGRDAELARLDAWLDGEDSPPRMLVTAPAGRGKSALLVRWIDGLRARKHGWTIVFVPISIRFATNAPEVFNQLLATQLAAVADIGLETPATEPATYYGDQVRELFSRLADIGTPVLVVLDGMDEALRGELDLTMFPRTLPRNVRVVASARWQVGDVDSEGWKRRLGWVSGVRSESFEVGALTLEGIEDVLARLGAPMAAVSRDRALVERLAQLTEGEPLLLRLYAEDLWQLCAEAQPITTAELDTLEPGFGPYLTRWLEAQQRLWTTETQSLDQVAVDAVLLVLAVALGPLEADDLLELVGDLRAERSTLAVGHLLKPLRRFVMGRGDRESGYVLSHPKIGQYLQEEYFSGRVVHHAQCAFARWGRSVVDALNGGARLPEEVSPYLLRFHSRHLTAGDGSSRDLMALVDNGWRRAWKYLEGGHQGFSNDVRRAWQAVCKEKGEGALGAELRCALALASIRSLGMNMPRQLIVQAVKKSVLSAAQGRDLAMLMRWPPEGVHTLGLIAVEAGHRAPERAARLGEALGRARGLSKRFDRAVALCRLAPLFQDDRRDEILGEALEAVRACPAGWSRAYAFAEYLPLVEGERRSVLLDEALAAREAITEDADRLRIVASLAPVLPADRLTEAFREALEVSQPDKADSRAWVLGDLAPHVDGAHREMLLDDVAHSEDGEARKALLAAIVPHLDADQVERAWSIASASAYGHAQALLLARRARSSDAPEVQSALLDQALCVIHGMTEDYERGWAIAGLAPDFDAERLAAAFDLVLAIPHPGVRAFAFAELASRLDAGGLRRALDSLMEIRDENLRAVALGRLAAQLGGEARDQRLAVALATARSATGWMRAAGLGRLAPLFAATEQDRVLAEAIAESRALRSASESAHARIVIMQSLADAERAPLIREVLDLWPVVRKYERGYLIEKLAPLLGGADAAFQEALALAESLSDEHGRSFALAGLLASASEGHRDRIVCLLRDHEAAEKNVLVQTWLRSVLAAALPADQRGDAIGAALESVRRTVEEEDFWRPVALSAIVPHLELERCADALNVARGIPDVSARVQVLRALAKRVPQDLYARMIEALLEVSGELSREDLLDLLAEYVPMLESVGGTRCLEAVYVAIKDVGNWT